MNRLPEKLSTLRKHYKYSQEYVAEILNIDVADYMGIENGRKVLNYEQTQKLAKFYRIPFEQLFINDKEVTLRSVDDTTTDQININFFLKQNKWYVRLSKKIKESNVLKALIVVVILSLVIMLSKYIKNVNKPLVFDNKYQLSVSKQTVSYIDDQDRLRITGSLSNIDTSNIISIATGNNFAIALKDNGTVISNGLNEKTTSEVSKLSNIVYITASDNHIIAIDKLGKIKTIGDNENGELDISKWKKVKNIKTFKTGTIGIDEKGYLVYAGNIIGRSQFTQYRNCKDYDSNEFMTVVLKNDNTVDYSALSDHYAVATGWKDIVDVCCGEDFIAGLKNDGTVLIVTTNEDLLDQTSKWKDIIAIDADDNYLIAFDGKNIYGAGDNTYNQFEKEEKQKIKLQEVSGQHLNIEVSKNEVTVQFDPVEHAYAYQVSMNVGRIITYEVLTNEKIRFSDLELEEGKFYTIQIVSKGVDPYVDSNPYEYVFEYKEDKQ